MVLAAANKEKRLLYLAFIGQVRAKELARDREQAVKLSAELPAGFRLLTDLSRLDSMDTNCESEISKLMEALDHNGIALVVRVIPSPSKDIGFNILGAFHYRRQVKAISCSTMEEAARLLGL